MSKQPPEELLEALKHYVTHEVRGGFASVTDIPAAAVEVVTAEDIEPADLLPYAEQYTADSLVQLHEEQQFWPDVTDCDRLDQAFADLEKTGLLSRQDFSCCQPCGHGDMSDEIESAIAQGRTVRGYTFYTWQDTEWTVDGQDLCLTYASVEDGDGATIAVGHEVVSALRASGLSVEWDGSIEKRIVVSVEWRRRRA